jgi:hypothetical protein
MACEIYDGQSLMAIVLSGDQVVADGYGLQRRTELQISKYLGTRRCTCTWASRHALQDGAGGTCRQARQGRAALLLAGSGCPPPRDGGFGG